MQALQAVMLAVRAETPRSAHLPRRMAAEVAVLVRVLLWQVLAVVVEVSVQRALLHPAEALMALAAAAPAALLLVSVP